MARKPEGPKRGKDEAGKRRGPRAGPKKAKAESDVAAPQAVALQAYDFENLPRLPLTPVRDPERDSLHAPACKMLREVLEWYESAFGRRSYDDAGGRIILFLRAPWSGGLFYDDLKVLRFSGPMAVPGYGGKPYYFGDFSASPDYVAHEFAHAVTNHCARLDYGQLEQAALHESLSDCFAIAFRDWRARRMGWTGPVEWRFGEGVAFAPLSCTRNLAAPGDPGAWTQGFAHWTEIPWMATPRPESYQIGAVASLAFRLAALTLGDDVARAASIWYRALTDPRMAGVAAFGAFADLTTRVAAAESAEAEQAVRGAWEKVGIAVSAPVAA